MDKAVVFKSTGESSALASAGIINRMVWTFLTALWNMVRFPALGFVKALKCLYYKLENYYDDEGIKGIGLGRIRG